MPLIKTPIAVLALAMQCHLAVAAEPNLIEGARRTSAYWNSVFRECGGPGGQKAWYGVSHDGSIAGSILMILDLEPQFKTEAISPVERLNGMEFRATTSLSPGQFRWWIAGTKVWRDWQIDEILGSIVFTKKGGVWSQSREFGIKPLENCSQVPHLDVER